MSSVARPPEVEKTTRRTPRIAWLFGVLLGLAVLAAYLYLAPLWAERQLAHASLTHLETLAREHPDDGRTLYYLAKRQQASGDTTAAVVTLL